MAKRKTTLYSIEESELDEVFNYNNSIDEHLENLRDKNVVKYRIKTIKSGKMIESLIYPLWNTNNSNRAKKIKSSRKTQKRLNAKNSISNAVRLINENFTDDDIWATFTYSDAKLPKDDEEAKKNMQNYLRRLKHYMEKHKMPPLKYFYVTESSDNPKKKVRINHHIIMNFPDRDLAESMWCGGKRKQTRRLQSDDCGYEGLARYITKTVKDADKLKNSKKYVASRNLKKPKVYIADGKISRRRANQIAEGLIDPRYLFMKMYKNYEFIDITTKTSEYVSGAYLHVRMKRKNEKMTN